LQRSLNEAGIRPNELLDAQNALRQLEAERAITDPENLATLLQAANEKVKKLEFTLRKKAEGENQPLSMSGSEEWPAAYREAIAEYYRSLAKKQQ